MDAMELRLDRIEDALTEIVELVGHPQKWLTIAQAARYSGLSQTVIRRMLDSGTLTCHRPTPGRLIVSVDELDAFIAASTGKPKLHTGPRGPRKDRECVEPAEATA